MSSTETTSQTDANVATVQGIYEAFGRGDVPAILERLAEDVQWEAWADNHGQRAGVPWMSPRTGREGVTGKARGGCGHQYDRALITPRPPRRS